MVERFAGACWITLVDPRLTRAQTDSVIRYLDAYEATQCDS